MIVSEFIRTVITSESGYFCLALSTPSGENWREEWFKWPEQTNDIIDRAINCATEFNVYFSSYLFSTRSRQKQFVVPSLTIQADLDTANASDLPLEPNVLVESSPNRYQAYWLLDELIDLDAHEILSRKLTYAIENCDRSGWPLGRMLRIAGTLNHKYLEGPYDVKVIRDSKRRHRPSSLELLPDVPDAKTDTFDESFIDNPPTDYEIGPQELLNNCRATLPVKVVQQYNVRARDRSAAIWALECAGFRIGLTREQVFWLAKHTANNKFADLRYHADRELAKDVLRAEALVQSKVTDARSAILEARKLPGVVHEKRQHLANLILAHMKEQGEFLRTTDDNGWYIRRDLGRPINITSHSQYLEMILDLQYGLNASEADQTYVVQSLSSHSRALPATAINASLSYYDGDGGVLLLHSGKKDVYRIGATHIETVGNGAYKLVFPWPVNMEPFAISPHKAEWHTILFGDCLNNVVGIESKHAMAMLRVWFLFLLFRNAAVSRPILALFGQPGAGKSTLFRRVYALLYGRQRSLGSVTKADDFDYAVSSDPLTVLDNVDTWEAWLPDRLALSASTSDITKRKLYSDTDVIVLKRQALVGITAHNPRFGREDVADRLLLLTFERLANFKPEGEIIERILRQRNQLWAGVVHDVQLVLSTPQPKHTPQFRVEDFARIGYWIATALGIEDDFEASITTVKGSQKQFTLDEEHVLVTALSAMVAKDTSPKWRSASRLWTDLEMFASDPHTFRKSYRNAVHLGKKLWAMQESLNATFNIVWKHDIERGARMWLITERNNGTS